MRAPNAQSPRTGAVSKVKNKKVRAASADTPEFCFSSHRAGKQPPVSLISSPTTGEGEDSVNIFCYPWLCFLTWGMESAIHLEVELFGGGEGMVRDSLVTLGGHSCWAPKHKRAPKQRQGHRSLVSQLRVQPSDPLPRLLISKFLFLLDSS